MSAKAIGWGGIYWKGDGIDEKGYRKDNGQEIIRINSKFYRPAEVNQLIGDASRAREKLGWVPKTSLEDMIHEMIDADLNSIEN